MWCKLVLFTVLVSHAVSIKHVSVDFVENTRQFDVSPGRIVSGWDASPGQFPYQASLRVRNNLGQLLGCGGSVIHQSWVLTAAHCTSYHIQVTVRAGLIRVAAAEYVGDSWEWYNHPSYKTNLSIVQPNDVSLIRLSIPITFSSNLQSIKLQSSLDAYRNYDNEQLIASGWGRIWTNGPTADRLQWTYLRGMGDFQCAQVYGYALINGNAICARCYNVTSQSVCQGDSGGPLVHIDSRGVHTLVGVTSFVAKAEDGGCHSGLPAGFIRPGPFQSWFQQITGLNLDTSRST